MGKKCALLRCRCGQIRNCGKGANFFQKALDKLPVSVYNGKAVRRPAAIAQSVERILGKDEVASSNLASSSKRKSVHESERIFVV